VTVLMSYGDRCELLTLSLSHLPRVGGGLCCWCADIYMSCVSSAHSVTSKGFHLVIVSTTVETDDPEAELTPGLDLLAPIKEKYYFGTFFQQCDPALQYSSVDIFFDQ